MNAKVSSTLDKVFQDRSRSNFSKALSRLEDGIKKSPNSLRLYTEAVDVAMESGESLKALEFFKQARKKFPDDIFELWTFIADKVGKYNDPIVGRFLVEQAIRNGEAATASSLLADLKDHTAEELLQRIRTKKQAMSSAIGGGLSAGDEIVSYAITEALLCIRLNLFAEAMDGVIRILDEKPFAHKLLEPFLVELERQHKEKGETAFALGCCWMAGGKHEAGLEKMIRATKIAPALMSGAIKRIESLGDNAAIPLATRQFHLAELNLAHGDIAQSEKLLRGILERDPTKASRVIEMLDKKVQEIGDNLSLHFLVIDAALGLGRCDTALGQLKKIFQKQVFREDLLAWLEQKSQTPGTDSGILLFYGEAALTEGMHGKAIEIFKDILSHGIREEEAIKALLLRHNSVPLVRHYYNDRFGAATVRESASNTKFETYDEFDLAETRLGGVSNRPSHLGAAASIKQVETRVDDKSPVFDSHKPDPPGETGAIDFGIDNREFSLGWQNDPDPDLSHTEPADTDSSIEPPRGDGGDLFDYLNKDFTGPEHQGREDPPADDAPEEKPANESSDFDFAPRDKVVELPPEDAPGLEEEVGETPKDFDALYAMFSSGRLDNTESIALIEQALGAGRLEEMKTVLAFTPVNIGEEITRKRLLAEYYLETDQPLAALIVLKTVNLNGLGKEQRKVFLTRIAACYRALHNFEAAHVVFLRLMSEHPGAADIERMAVSNYDQYLQSVTDAAPALERVSSL